MISSWYKSLTLMSGDENFISEIQFDKEILFISDLNKSSRLFDNCKLATVFLFNNWELFRL